MKPSKVLRNIKENQFINYGICGNFDFKYRYSLFFCMKAHSISFNQWEHFSGSYAFPVPAQNPAVAYSRFNKWSKKSKYGQLRWQLLDWLIEQFEAKGA